MSRIILVHLSDLHIGSVFRNVNFRSRMPQPFNLLGGLDGHDSLLCEMLRDILREIRADLGMSNDESMHYVVSGDLTRSGSEQDFAMCWLFLESGWRYNIKTEVVGLNLGRDHAFTIPGNHDHWEGRTLYPQASYSPGIYGCFFEDKVETLGNGTTKPRWRRTLSANDGKLQLEMLGVDSNSGFKGQRLANYSAEGKISKGEFARLGELLDECDDDRRRLPAGVKQLRAFVCHHSFSNALARFPRPLIPQHRRRLVDLATERDVPVVLTGHTHFFEHNKFFPSGNAKPVLSRCYELRSSAATQGPASLSGANQPNSQGFQVHEVDWNGTTAAASWTVHRYRWINRRFAHFETLKRISIP